MTKYASAIIAFAAALTGIVGDTHDATRSGMDRITLLGWGAIITAFLGFVVILIETYRDHKKIDWQAQQKAKVQDIANRQVIEAVMHLLKPFRIFLSQEVWSKRSDLEIDLDKLDKSASYIIELLSKPIIQSEFENVDLRSKPNVHPPVIWWEYFADSAQKARDLLNQAAAKYSGYLTPDTLVAVETLRVDDVIAFRLSYLGELVSMNDQIIPFPLSNAFGMRGDDYIEFNIMLCKIRNVLVHTNDQENT